MKRYNPWSPSSSTRYMPLTVPPIYLASRSPRRRELLHQINVRFEVLSFRAGDRADTDTDESAQPGERPEDYVRRVALAKADAGIRRVQLRHLPPHPVLAADTSIDLDGHIIGKPADRAEAADILARLSGRSHRVLSAVAISDGERTEQQLSINQVRFRTLTPVDIRNYVATGEPLDKAGAYAIQGRAAMFVEDIHGSYSGIMGLPLFETARLLARFGYPL